MTGILGGCGRSATHDPLDTAVSTMTFHEGVEFAGRTIEAVGVGIILIGTLVVLVIYAAAALRSDRNLADEYAKGRRGIGKVLLLGLATRYIAVPLMITMVVAAATVHWENGWFAIAPSNPETSAARPLASVAKTI